MPKSRKRSKNVKKSNVKKSVRKNASPKKVKKLYKMSNPAPHRKPILQRIIDAGMTPSVEQFFSEHEILQQGPGVWGSVVHSKVRDSFFTKFFRIDRNAGEFGVFKVNNDQDFEDAIDILEHGNFFDFVTSININDRYKLDIEKIKKISKSIKKNKNQYVDTLNMAGNNINDDMSRVLADALRENTTLLHINVHENYIGDAGKEALSSVFSFHGRKSPLPNSPILYGLNYQMR